MNIQFWQSSLYFLQQCKQLILPPFCAYCYTFALESEQILCQSCISAIQPVVSHELSITKTISMKVYAIGAYCDPLSTLIRAKIYGNVALSRQLGKLLWQQSCIAQLQPDFFIPIPLHWTRYAWRGYNQTTEMAQVLSSLSGAPTVELLTRRKKTKLQAGLNSQERQENLENALILHCVDKTLYSGKHLVIIDDLMTTGVTLQQAARVLLPLQPARLSALVVSRVI